MKIIGHRGAMGYEPENTIPSFRKALDMGVDMVELDVYERLGRLVVIHDDRVDRTTNGSGYVWGLDIETLRSLDAGNGNQIPFLEEVLDVINNETVVNIELKGKGTALPVSKMIGEYLKNGWTAESFVVSSFNHHELHEFSKHSPDVRTGALIIGIPIDYAGFAQELGAYSLNPSIEFVDADFISDAHRRGLEVNVFTVNHPEDIKRMLNMGVDGIFTNVPDVAKMIVAEQKS